MCFDLWTTWKGPIFDQIHLTLTAGGGRKAWCTRQSTRRGFIPGATHLWKLVFAQRTVRGMVQAALKAFEAKCMSTGCSDRFKEQPGKIMRFQKDMPRTHFEASCFKRMPYTASIQAQESLMSTLLYIFIVFLENKSITADTYCANFMLNLTQLESFEKKKSWLRRCFN